jgi:hypothetical protein
MGGQERRPISYLKDASDLLPDVLLDTLSLTAIPVSFSLMHICILSKTRGGREYVKSGQHWKLWLIIFYSLKGTKHKGI